MRTPDGNTEPLRLRELMHVVRDLRMRGFALNPRPLFLSGQQLRSAVVSFLRFRRNIRMALMIHLIFLALLIGSVLATPTTYTILLGALAFFSFLGFLFLSHYYRTEFYQALGRPSASGAHLGTFILGLPLYIIVYYHTEKRLRTELSGVFRELGLLER